MSTIWAGCTCTPMASRLSISTPVIRSTSPAGTSSRVTIRLATASVCTAPSGDIDHLAQRFVEFSAVHIFVRYAGHQLTEAEAAEAVGTVRRLRPLAQSVVDAELARAMRSEATKLLDAAVAGPLRQLVDDAFEDGAPAGGQGLTDT